MPCERNDLLILPSVMAYVIGESRVTGSRAVEMKDYIRGPGDGINTKMILSGSRAQDEGGPKEYGYCIRRLVAATI